MAEPDIEYCAHYPFTKDAKGYVASLGLSLADILEHPVYKACLEEGRRRFLDGLRGGINPELGDRVSREVAVLSYPIARIIANLLGYVQLRRYASAEAKAAYEHFSESAEDVVKLSVDLGLDFLDNTLSLSEYLLLSEGLARRDERFMLVNRVVSEGRVLVEEGERKALLAEKVACRVLESVNVKHAPKQITEIAKSIERNIAAAQQRDFDGDLSSSPPCVKQMIALIESGQGSHHIMFILGTYLIGRGLGEDQIVEVFSGSPSFDENKCRYQLKFLSGERGATKYSCPSCVKVKSYGLCNWDCGIKHPLQYKGKKPT